MPQGFIKENKEASQENAIASFGGFMITLEKNTKILFSGDSITDGGRSRNMDLNHYLGHGYQYILSGKLGVDNIDKNLKFINKGYSGGGISTVYNTWYSDCLKLRPDIISILIGINDVLGSTGEVSELNIKRFENIYSMMLSDTRDFLPQAKIILCEPFYINAKLHEEYLSGAPHIECEPKFIPLNIVETEDMIKNREKEVKEIQKITKDLAEKFNCIFVPLQKIFEENVKKTGVEYLLWDGFHPTVIGHELIARQWYKSVEKAL